MWNVELKTLGCFSSVPVHNLGNSGQVSPIWPNTWVPEKQYSSTHRGPWHYSKSLHMIWVFAPIPKYLWNRYSLTHRRPWHYSKVSFDVKQGAEEFGLLFMCLCTWFGVFGPSFPKLFQYLSTCETGIISPTEGLDTSIRFHSGPFPSNCPNTQVPKKRV